jgi:hypothetical protein
VGFPESTLLPAPFLERFVKKVLSGKIEGASHDSGIRISLPAATVLAGAKTYAKPQEIGYLAWKASRLIRSLSL